MVHSPEDGLGVAENTVAIISAALEKIEHAQKTIEDCSVYCGQELASNSNIPDAHIHKQDRLLDSPDGEAAPSRS